MITVRPYQESDRAPLHRALVDTGAFRPDEVVVALEVMDGALTGEYPHLVAERDGEVVGYVSVGPTPLTASTWHLYWICVAPAAQGSGAAAALQEAAERFVAERGGRRLVLETSGKAEYARQRAFYLKVGYAEVGRIADFYADGDDVVYFVKVIAPEG